MSQNKINNKTMPLTHFFAILIISLAIYLPFCGKQFHIAQDVRPFCTGGRLYFGGRLGYLYSMNKAGYYDIATTQQKPDSGDFVLRNTFHGDDLRLIQDSSRIEKICDFRYKLFPLTTMGGYAGFYGGNRLPCWFIPGHSYDFSLYRVIR
jgi:hypothetical protein